MSMKSKRKLALLANKPSRHDSPQQDANNKETTDRGTSREEPKQAEQEERE
jgi:hypothetical protein